MPEQALAGLKVLDLTHFVAGPYCTRLLAGLGAEVIKVERPRVGDGARHIGPFPGDKPDPEKSGLFLHLNTGKKSITLDLKTDTGREISQRLSKEADILVENFRPHVMPSLGLDYAALVQHHPKLVMTSVSNFGQTGPYRDYGATELGLYATSGTMSMIGDPNREPIKKGGFMVQYTGGTNAFGATLVALWHALQTGEGQHVDIAINECAATVVDEHTKAWTYAGKISKREIGRGSTDHPSGLSRCKDGWVGVAVRPADRWPLFAEIIDPRLADPRYSTRPGRVQHRKELDEIITPWLMAHTKEEIYNIGQKRRVAWGHVCNAEDLLNSPHLSARQFFVELDHPEAGKLKYPGAPFGMGETPWQSARAPLLGEHNEEIYCGRLGYTKGDLARLSQRGVI